MPNLYQILVYEFDNSGLVEHEIQCNDHSACKQTGKTTYPSQ